MVVVVVDGELVVDEAMLDVVVDGEEVVVDVPWSSWDMVMVPVPIWES
jgi:hypothetical protein